MLAVGTGTLASHPLSPAKLSKELGQGITEQGAILPSLPAAPFPAGLGRKQVRGNMAAALFPATPVAAGWEGWQRACAFPARQGLGTHWGSSGYECTDTDGL